MVIDYSNQSITLVIDYYTTVYQLRTKSYSNWYYKWWILDLQFL